MNLEGEGGRWEEGSVSKFCLSLYLLIYFSHSVTIFGRSLIGCGYRASGFSLIGLLFIKSEECYRRRKNKKQKLSK